jgi:hypothetical protein
MMTATALLRIGALDVDLRTGEIHGGSTDRLAPLERALLSRLAEANGELVSAEALLRDVWGYAPTALTRTVGVTFARLRRRLEPDPARPRYLLTVQGVGYRLRSAPPPPSPSVRLLGRHNELAWIAGWLARPTSRWLTVYGPGGIGKSALLDEIQAAKGSGLAYGAVQRPACLDDDALDRCLRAATARPYTLVLVDLQDGDPGPLRARVSEARALPHVRVIAAARCALDARGESVLRLAPLPKAAARDLVGPERVALVPAAHGLPLALALARAAPPPPADVSPRDWLEGLRAPSGPCRHASLQANRASTLRGLPEGATREGWADQPASLLALGQAGVLEWDVDGRPHLARWLRCD